MIFMLASCSLHVRKYGLLSFCTYHDSLSQKNAALHFVLLCTVVNQRESTSTLFGAASEVWQMTQAPGRRPHSQLVHVTL
jgi:hypothetical protein